MPSWLNSRGNYSMKKAHGWNRCKRNILLMRIFFATEPKRKDSGLRNVLWRIDINSAKVLDGSWELQQYWLDNWCANNGLANMLNLSHHSLIDTSLKVSQFITACGEWDTTNLSRLVDRDRWQLILATPLPHNPIPDYVCWGLSGNDDFSAKSATWGVHGLDQTSSLS